MKPRWLLLFIITMAAPLSAQQDSSMRVAVRLVTEGRGDSARALVRRRLATAPLDSSYAEVLYTAGIVAAHPDTALRYLRRTTIEYSQSPWADRAFLRLAQMAFASGDATATFASAERVITDYPFSPIRAQAAYWAGRAQIDLGNLATACRYLRQAADSSGDDVETANRARFYVQRCINLSNVVKKDSVRPDTTAAVTPKPVTPVSAAKPASGPKTYAVQVAAVRSVGAADQSMQALKRAGYEPRVARDADGFFKVRVGSFKTKAEAQRLGADVKRKTNLTPFVVEEP